MDDEWLSVGSANLNARGLVTDCELNAVINDAEVARGLRVDLWSEHLGLSPEQVAATDPIELISRWAARAAENANIVCCVDRPLASKVYRYERAGVPGVWLLEEAQALTL